MQNVACYDSLGNYITKLYQWDVDQYLTIKNVPISPLPVFQFAHPKCRVAISVTPSVNGSELIVAVPNELLENAEPIIAFVHRKQLTGNGKTLGAIHIPVIPRIKPSADKYADKINYK